MSLFKIILTWFSGINKSIPKEDERVISPSNVTARDFPKEFTLVELMHSNTADNLGISNTPNQQEMFNMYTLVQQGLLPIRELCGNKPMPVTSCFRNEQVNRAVGGSPTSAHRYGLAADFTVKGIPVKQVCQMIIDSGLSFDQLIYEQGAHSQWIHFGFNTKGNEHNRRQVLSKKYNTGYVQGLVDL